MDLAFCLMEGSSLPPEPSTLILLRSGLARLGVLPGENADQADQAERGVGEVNFYVETFLMWAILVILAVVAILWLGRGK